MSNKTEPNKMDELLQAIKEGELSKDEIIKRLNSAIDREYQKKKGADMAFVAACENLLDKLLDSVYLRSSQNSQPNSDASDVNSRKERGRVFRIARSDPPPAF